MLNNLKNKITGFFDSKKAPDKNAPPHEEDGQIEELLWKEQIVSYVKEEFERRRLERLPLELQWRLNMNFLKGNQYCDINEVSMNIMEVDKPYFWSEREVFNHLAPIVETRLSKLGRLRPAMTTRPATSDEEDISTAKVCKNITDSAYEKLKMRNKISSAAAWAEICGSAFYKNTWNKDNGKLVGYVNSIIEEEEGQEPKTVMEALYEGDIETTVVPAYEIFPDSILNDEVEKCKSIIHAKAYTVDEIKEIWNITVTGQDVDVYSLGMSSIGTGGLGYNATIPSIATTVKPDSETVLEYWELPSKKYPNGRLIIVAGTELLYYGKLPYKNGIDFKRTFPFIRQNCTDNPGSFFGTTVIERCIPVQRRYNAVKNRKQEFLNRAAIGVLTYEEDTIDDETLQEDGLAPGSIIPRSRGSAPPTFIQSGNLPPEFAQEEEKLMNEFIMISGVSELSRNSNAPTGVGSGIALEVLKEQDDTRISLTANIIREAIIVVASQWLRLYKQFATGPRIDRIVGNNNQVLVAKWSASDITTDDVVNETEDDLAQTPAQRKQQVMDMFQLGLFINPDTGQVDKETKAKIFDMLSMGNWEDANSIDKLHIAKAQRENLDIQEGLEIKVRDFDNDELHIVEHNKFRLSGDYAELEKQRPDLSQYLDFHIGIHEQSIAMKQQIAVQNQLALQPPEAQSKNVK